MTAVLNSFWYADSGPPTDVTGHLRFHLDGTNPGSSTSTTWEDASGNGHDFDGTGHMPTYNSDGYFSFNGSSQYVDGPDGNAIFPYFTGPLGPPYDNSIYTFMLLKRYSDASETGFNTAIFDVDGGGGTSHYAYNGIIYISHFATSRHTCGNPTLALNQWLVMMIKSKQSDFKVTLSKTGTEEALYSTTSSNLTNGATTTRFGRDATTSSYYFQGDIAQILAYGSNTDLTADDVTAIKDWLHAKADAIP